MSLPPLRQRGILFSMISVLLATFFILLFWNSNAPRLDTTVGAVETRVSVIDQYVTSWDSFIEDTIRLTTRQALIKMTDEYRGNRTPVNLGNITANLSRCLITGSFNPEGRNVACTGAVEDTLSSRLDNFSKIAAEELNIKTTYEIDPNITVQDWSAFEVLITLNISYTIGDSFALWNETARYDVIVSVVDLPDPLFSRHAQYWIENKYQKRNITKFDVGRSSLTQKNLSDLIESGAYVANKGMGPTYLERMAGIITGDLDAENRSGIETLIDPEITVPLVDPFNRSYTAHQLFTGNANIYECGIETLGINVSANFSYGRFRFDIPHIAAYNMGDAPWNQSCS